MKITKRQLRRIIKEEIATVNDDAIEDAVMAVLSDEGGAAGLEPIEDALEDLEDDDISLPDEDIEDIIGDVTGVKRHADGDFIDTTQLEGKTVKITKKQLRKIIREGCGIEAAPAPAVTAPAVVSEGIPPEQALVVEMEVASRALSQVIESVQNAAQLCTNCNESVAAQAPLVEAMVAQAEALQENLDAQAEMVLENAEGHDAPLIDAVVDVLDV